MNGNIGYKNEMFSQVDFGQEEALSVSGKDACGIGDLRRGWTSDWESCPTLPSLE